MQIAHKFYLGQKVKAVYKDKEIIGRVIEIKIRTKGNGARQIADDKAMPAYRLEGMLGNVMEDIIQPI